jgi:pimeloyl-ACP methyl ester carboxylesterase
VTSPPCGGTVSHLGGWIDRRFYSCPECRGFYSRPCSMGAILRLYKLMKKLKPSIYSALSNTLGGMLLQVSQAGVKPRDFTQRQMSINNQPIWYQEIGQGPPVVFVHGLGASSLSWIVNLAVFSRERRAIALDQVGHGRSAKPALNYQIRDFVQFLEQFLDNLQLRQVDLVGNSLGGWVSAHLALKRPDLVRRLVLVGSAGLRPSPALVNKLQTVPFAPRTIAQMRTMLSLCFYDKPRYTSPLSVTISYLMRQLESSHSTVEAVLQAVLNDPDAWLNEHLPKLQLPTLLLWGQEDELVPVSMGEEFAAGLPQAQLVVFDQCGHVPQIEKAARFNQVVGDFLRQ